MDLSKFTGLTDLWKLSDKAQSLGEELGEENPELFANQVLNALINLKFDNAANDDSLKNILDLFQGEDNLKSLLYAASAADGDQPVTVTETSVSLPDEPGSNASEPKSTTPYLGDILEEITDPNNTSTVEQILSKYGLNNDKPSESLEGGTTPEEEQMLAQAEKNAAEDKLAEPKEDKPAEPKDKPAEDKPKEDKPAEPKEDKPKEKKEEPKEDKPKETSKDESDDTMKNITSALSDRF